MANTAQARKRVRQATRRRPRNVSLRSKVRTYIKMVRQAIAEEDKAAAQEAYKQAVPIIDHGSSEGVLHRNAAARHKSRLNAKVRALGG
ncbi:MAG: 30S ribosomal protein S20 [Acidiferrobacterales bacterium]